MDMLGHIILKFETPTPNGKGVTHACAGPVFFHSYCTKSR